MGPRAISRPVPSLFGHTRGAVLAHLYGHTEESFYLRQLARTVGTGHGALQRELRHLTEMGLVVRTVRGNQTLYRANSRSPIFSEVRSLIAKTVGIYFSIRVALETLGTRIAIAFVFGSVARQQERAGSDVDLMVLGEVSFGDVVSALRPVQTKLGREINPTVFSVSELRSKLAAGNHFLNSLVREKKQFLIGTQHDFAKLVAK